MTGIADCQCTDLVTGSTSNDGVVIHALSRYRELASDLARMHHSPIAQSFQLS